MATNWRVLDSSPKQVVKFTPMMRVMLGNTMLPELFINRIMCKIYTNYILFYINGPLILYDSVNDVLSKIIIV
jgi:hypothetical protein